MTSRADSGHDSESQLQATWGKIWSAEDIDNVEGNRSLPRPLDENS